MSFHAALFTLHLAGLEQILKSGFHMKLLGSLIVGIRVITNRNVVAVFDGTAPYK